MGGQDDTNVSMDIHLSNDIPNSNNIRIVFCVVLGYEVCIMDPKGFVAIDYKGVLFGTTEKMFRFLYESIPYRNSQEFKYALYAICAVVVLYAIVFVWAKFIR